MNEGTALRLIHTLERVERQLAIVTEAVGPLGDWISTEQARKHYGLSESYLYELARKRKIRKSKNGHSTRWNRFDLERYVFGV